MIEIKIAGKGGQGIVLVGEILAGAAILEGKFASAIAGYGSEARGGEVSCDVMISEEEIASPFVTTPHYLIFLSSGSYKRNLPLISEETKVFLEGAEIKDCPLASGEARKWGRNHFPVPAQETAQKLFQSPQVANMVMLGYFARVTKIVSLESLIAVLSEKMKGEILKTNIKALKEGYEKLVREARLRQRRGGEYEDKNK